MQDSPTAGSGRAVRILELAGSPTDIGRGHGQLLGEQIHQCLDIYRLVLDRSDAELRRAGARARQVVELFAPDLATEIDAIGAATDIDPHLLHALNARSELMAGRTDGCTTVFLPHLGLLGQTWDWLEALEPLMVLLRITPDHGPALVTLTEPGMVGKIGLNSAGVGVCLNFLHAAGPHHGVPVHVLLRRLLHDTDLQECGTTIRRAGAGRAANVVVGTATDGGIEARFLGEEVRTRALTEDAFACTNHADGRPETGGDLYENSCARAVTARRLVSDVTDLASLVQLLDDRSDARDPVCAPYRPYLGTTVGTTAMVAMDLPARRLHVRAGPRPGELTQRSTPSTTIGEPT